MWRGERDRWKEKGDEVSEEARCSDIRAMFCTRQGCTKPGDADLEEEGRQKPPFQENTPLPKANEGHVAARNA